MSLPLKPKRPPEMRPSTPLTRERVRRARSKAKVKAGAAGTSLTALVKLDYILSQYGTDE